LGGNSLDGFKQGFYIDGHRAQLAYRGYLPISFFEEYARNTVSGVIRFGCVLIPPSFVQGELGGIFK
jgi:hypothetical protein